MPTVLIHLITCLLLALAVASSPEDGKNNAATMLSAQKTTKDGCDKYCGSLLIPYPFGIGLDCSLNPFYSVTCDNSTYNPPKAFLINNNTTLNTSEIQTPRRVHEILNITETIIHVRNRVIYQCRNDTINNLDKDGMILPIDSPFVFSNVSNQIIAVGCGILNTYQSNEDVASSAGPRCNTTDGVKPGKCGDENDCDEEPIGKAVKEFNYSLSRPDPTGSPSVRCAYGFIGDVSAFEHRGTNDTDDPIVFIDRVQKDVPLVIDWVIGNQTCKDVVNTSAYACQKNANCSDAGGGISGYRCNCNRGFQGNPYLLTGCTDIKSDLCRAGNNKKGSSCPKKPEHLTLLLVSGGVLLGVAIAILLIYMLIQKKRSIKKKEKLFTKNGGLLLKGQLSSMSQGGIELIKIFTEKEIKIATNNFSDTNIAGRGGSGIVYKGRLEDNTLIAVKKATIIDEVQIEQFINELVILSQINHRNVVKLLGCCLEVEVPLLIYEFISNGALFNHIHNDSNEGYSLNWRECLRVVSEIANAIAYLHCSANSPIIHRDIKSANVLLDENYTAKISDFGASRLIPVDKTKLATAVQGTLGYLDPEYLFSSELTEKSDIYSFGVLVAEILTGKKAVFYVRGKYQNLATTFVELTMIGKLEEILDPKLIESGNMDEVMFVAEIVSNCLSSKGVQRPLMKDIAVQFDRLANQVLEDH